jgi:predicted site-specific integrase-resolvase
MTFYSTREAAKKLGIPYTTLATYVTVGKVPGPQTKISGTANQIWTEAEIEHVRQLLPKIANGRKTRYKKHSAVSTQQSAKAKPKKPKKKK